MIPFRLTEIAKVINAKVFGRDCVISSIITDTRSFILKENCLFIALIGKNFDAHNFIFKVINSGISAILVNKKFPTNVSQLVVSDTNHALGLIGAFIRSKTSTKILAITGSSGKTSVKEMSHTILKQNWNVICTKKNFNNHIGVPKTLIQLTLEHNFAIIELGASSIGEIAWMSGLIKPKVALVNNFHESHLRGFGSLSNIAKAKGEIFSELSNQGIGILNADSNDWENWKKILNKKKVLRFSIKKSKNVDFFSSQITPKKKGIKFVLNTPVGKCSILLPLFGKHNIYNALAAAASTFSLGASLSEISYGLSIFSPIPRRLFPIVLSKGKILIDDSYNANLGSVNAAIDTLSRMPGYRVIVIGNIEELGSKEINYHRKIGIIIDKTNIEKIISIGNLSYFISKMSVRGEHFKDKNSLIFRLCQLLKKHKKITILIKGSNNTKMDKIVDILKEMYNVNIPN